MAKHIAPVPSIAPEVRTYIYGVAVALLSALAFYNVLAPEAIPVWTEVIEAALGIAAAGTAYAYRPTKPAPEAEPEAEPEG